MMTPRLFSQIFIIALSVFIFSSCSKDSSVTVVPPSLKGAFVLYESASAGGSDYCFIDVGQDSVFNNLYQNSNGGIALMYTPGDIKKLRDDQNLYIVCGGLQGQNGKIYEINTSNNRIVNSVSFGANPQKFDLADNRIYVSSTGGAFVTQFDLNLNVIDGFINVGPLPGRISFTSGRFFVCKDAFSPERTLAIVSETNNFVTIVDLSFSPAALISNTAGYFMTEYGVKNVYRMDSTSFLPIDSLSIPTSGSSAGDMIKEGQLKSLVVVDSSEVWEINYTNAPATTKLLIPFPGGSFKISGIAYEDVSGRIYIADNNGGPPYLGKVHVYDPSSGQELKSYLLIGRNPVGFAFKY